MKKLAVLQTILTISVLLIFSACNKSNVAQSAATNTATAPDIKLAIAESADTLTYLFSR
jgi:hypothetical protein